jgi:hypothetical protein
MLCQSPLFPLPPSLSLSAALSLSVSSFCLHIAGQSENERKDAREFLLLGVVAQEKESRKNDDDERHTKSDGARE